MRVVFPPFSRPRLFHFPVTGIILFVTKNRVFVTEIGVSRDQDRWFCDHDRLFLQLNKAAKVKTQEISAVTCRRDHAPCSAMASPM